MFITHAVAAMDMLHAREMIDAVNVSAFTTMKKEARAKLESSWKNAMNPPRERKAISMDDLAKIIGGK